MFNAIFHHFFLNLYSTTVSGCQHSHTWKKLSNLSFMLAFTFLGLMILISLITEVINTCIFLYIKSEWYTCFCHSAPLASTPVWARDFSSSEELITEFCRECRVVRKGFLSCFLRSLSFNKLSLVFIHINSLIFYRMLWIFYFVYALLFHMLNRHVVSRFGRWSEKGNERWEANYNRGMYGYVCSGRFLAYPV